MNPEFQRNLWIELTPRRLTLMVLLLALAFFAAALSDNKDFGPAKTAGILYYAIVVVWGTRNAALAVVGEIRERTWDMQLLSSIAPGTMTWGKLFGSTIYNWFGGAICLAVVLSDIVAHQGPAVAAIALVYFVAVGVISQAAAFLASLIAARRRHSHSRLDIFVYQVVGIFAALTVFWVWSFADPEALAVPHLARTDVIWWWGMRTDARSFVLVSLAVFTAWTLVGCYREMRLELKMRNGTAVWLAFLVFIGVYVAGLDGGIVGGKDVVGWDAVSLRLALAAFAYGALTYLMVVLEPKDRVHYRWLGRQFASARLGAFWNGLQAWMLAYAATALTTVSLLVWLHLHRPDIVQVPALLAAMLGFLTRDVAIFVVMRSRPGRRRGDWAALGILLALYVLAPQIVTGLGLNGSLMLFRPEITAPLWLSPAVAWAEGLAVAVLALGRIAISKPAVATA